MIYESLYLKIKVDILSYGSTLENIFCEYKTWHRKGFWKQKKKLWYNSVSNQNILFMKGRNTWNLSNENTRKIWKHFDWFLKYLNFFNFLFCTFSKPIMSMISQPFRDESVHLFLVAIIWDVIPMRQNVEIYLII